jgi:hypothetical protein
MGRMAESIRPQVRNVNARLAAGARTQTDADCGNKTGIPSI